MSDSGGVGEQNLPPERPAEGATAAEEFRERADTVRPDIGAEGFPAILKVSRQRLKGPNGRVAILAGARTPFAKAGSDLRELDAIDLAGIAAAEAVARSGVDPAAIDVAIFGVVVPPLHGPNLGREVVFRAALPDCDPGHHGQSRLRLVEPGDHLRRRVDPARAKPRSCSPAAPSRSATCRWPFLGRQLRSSWRSAKARCPRRPARRFWRRSGRATSRRCRPRSPSTRPA